jgi:hypothetical protein
MRTAAIDLNEARQQASHRLTVSFVLAGLIAGAACAAPREQSQSTQDESYAIALTVPTTGALPRCTAAVSESQIE